MKLFVYGTLKKGYGLHHVLSRSLRIGSYITKQKGFRMTGFWYPFIFKDKTSKFSVKGELYDVDQNDFITANRIELGAGYELKEIDKDIYGYVYPTKVDDLSISVIKNKKDNYYEWRSTSDMPKVQET
tara:strand:- start:620 stop:1003 length:384 start_codon:yes stop_codon:yes gene_type:complete